MLTELPWAGIVALLAVIGVLATGMSLFDGFPWDALATLLAGGAAVVGAIYIGRRQMELSRGQNTILDRQVDIATRQADILAKQVQLEALKLRGDLYERRFEVFSATLNLLRSTTNNDRIIGSETLIAFAQARDRSRFLFSSEVNLALERIHKDCLIYTHKALSHNQRLAVGEGADEEAREVMDLQADLIHTSINLADIFGPEMHVGDDAFQQRAAIVLMPEGDDEQTVT